jgi:hypothetical protein
MVAVGVAGMVVVRKTIWRGEGGWITVAPVLERIADIMEGALDAVAVHVWRRWLDGQGSAIGVAPGRGVSLLRSRVNLFHGMRRAFWGVNIVGGSEASGRKVRGHHGTSREAGVDGAVVKRRRRNHFQKSQKQATEGERGDINIARRRSGRLGLRSRS